MIANIPSSTVVPNKAGGSTGSYALIGLAILAIVAAYVDYNYTHFFLNKPKEAPKA